MMATLKSDAIYPPGGFKYFEPSIGWRADSELALQGLSAVAGALAVVRAQNPASGLNPDYYACVDAVRAFTCARLKYDAKWCALPPEEAQRVGSPTATRKCASCGRRR